MQQQRQNRKKLFEESCGGYSLLWGLEVEGFKGLEVEGCKGLGV
jgi:hypothetical protein